MRRHCMSVFRYFSIPAVLLCGVVLFSLGNANAQPAAFQGFETPADLACWSGDGTITRVPSGGGVLHVPSFDGNFHAEITNQDDAYQAPGFGDSKFTEFCLPPTPGYVGDLSQFISVCILPNSTPPAQPSTPAFWIDEAPRDVNGLIADGAGPPASNFTAEHNFRFYANGTNVQVGADDQAPFATLTQQGWYTFQLTWRKAATGASPVLSDFNVFGPTGNLVGTTTRPAVMVGTAPPLPSSQLGQSGYLWFTVWQNHFANDILAIDDAGVGPTTRPPFPASCDLFFCWFFEA